MCSLLTKNLIPIFEMHSNWQETYTVKYTKPDGVKNLTFVNSWQQSKTMAVPTLRLRGVYQSTKINTMYPATSLYYDW